MISNYEDNGANFYGVDVYAHKADSYEQLPWICDADFFNLIFKNFCCNECPYNGIVDLGCGPATLGKFVAKYIGVPYIGIERSEEMYQKAKINLRGIENTALVHGDFTHYRIPKEGFVGCLLVMKNVLHLSRDYIDTVLRTISNFSGARRLLIVETVSPSLEALEWVQGLYLRLGFDYKQHWFIKGELAQQFEKIGFRCVRDEYHPQYIDVFQWLTSFGLSQEAISLAESYVDDAPEVVKQQMAIKWNADEKLIMLRLQNVLELTLS
jgi:SAM-dependent methyltransferase